MFLSRGEIDILFSASEDCIPLWEAKWEASPESPGLPKAELIVRCQEVLRKLLALGFIELFRCRSWSDSQETLLAPEEWERSIADVNQWYSLQETERQKSEEDDSYYCFFITDRGKEYYVNSEEVTAYHRTKWYSVHSDRRTEVSVHQ